ncbi:MAG: hypothetical protein GYA23_08705 [Methanomicrobiales archaeon]|nr:hypothetical protein [Methanomicrobiales archaeon]
MDRSFPSRHLCGIEAGAAPEQNAMTTHHRHSNETETGHAAHHARSGSDATTPVSPHRMPAGGWIREIATSENWRTTTIVQRHRDRAATNPTC